MHHDLGYVDLEQKTLQPIYTPFGQRVSPISSPIRSVTYVSGTNLAAMVPKGAEPEALRYSGLRSSGTPSFPKALLGFSA